MDRRLTFTAARMDSVTASAMATGSSWPAEYPSLAPSLIQSSTRTAPRSTTTALASQGMSSCRIRVACRARKLGFGAATLLPLVAAVVAVHLASPVLEYLATAVTAAIRPASAVYDQVGCPPNPTKCAIVPSNPVLLVSHEISRGTASIARASPIVNV